MKNVREYLVGMVIGAIVIILLLNYNNKIGSTTKIEYEYVTDTLTVYEPFEVHDTLELLAPPKTFIVYIDTTPSDMVVNCNDSVITLHDTITNYTDTMDYDFIRKFPKSNKLVELKLNMDSMEITLLNNKAMVWTQKYPMDFKHYRYQFLSDSLMYEELPKPKLSERVNLNHSLYGVGEYEFLSKTPLVGLEYLIQMNRFNIRFKSTSSIETSPNLSLYVGGMYKIK